jgi:hypothetical protein
LVELAGYCRTYLYLVYQNQLIGKLEFHNCGETISRMRVCAEIADQVGVRLFDLDGRMEEVQLWAETLSAVDRLLSADEPALAGV